MRNLSLSMGLNQNIIYKDDMKIFSRLPVQQTFNISNFCFLIQQCIQVLNIYMTSGCKDKESRKFEFVSCVSSLQALVYFFSCVLFCPPFTSTSLMRNRIFMLTLQHEGGMVSDRPHHFSSEQPFEWFFCNISLNN